MSDDEDNILEVKRELREKEQKIFDLIAQLHEVSSEEQAAQNAAIKYKAEIDRIIAEHRKELEELTAHYEEQILKGINEHEITFSEKDAEAIQQTPEKIEYTIEEISALKNELNSEMESLGAELDQREQEIK